LRWEVFFDLFLDDVPRGNRGFFNDILDSGGLGTVYLDRGGELDGCRDGCDTGIRRGRSAEHW